MNPDYLPYLLLGGAALLLVLLAGRLRAKPAGSRAAAESAPEPAAAPSPAFGPEIVAVVAAAVAASSGMAPGQFRIASVAASSGGGQFNTPVWGHVDRLVRTSHTR
jgi:hypothetical protein